MNTPAHVILNLWLLKKEEKKSCQTAVMVGALLPDLPMFGFYFYEKVIRHTPEAVIWNDYYHLSGWQNFFDIFNSIPFAVTGLAVTLWRKARLGALFFGSILLHIAGDFFLHHHDAHAHFFPLSDWRFQSPVSYWDPRYYGDVAGLAELALTVCIGVLLIRSFKMTFSRALTGFWLVFYLIYGIYVFVVWI